MPDHRLRESLRPLVEAMLPASELRRQQAIASAIGDDGNVRPDAVRRATPLALATFFVAGALAIGTDQAVAVRMAQPARIRKIDAIVKAPPTGGNLGVRVTINGAQMGMVTVQDGTVTNASGLDQPVSAGDVLRIDIAAVGATTPGTGLSVNVSYQPIVN